MDYYGQNIVGYDESGRYISTQKADCGEDTGVGTGVSDGVCIHRDDDKQPLSTESKADNDIAHLRAAVEHLIAYISTQV